MKQLLLSLAATCSMAPAFAQKYCNLPDATLKGGLLYYGSIGGFTSGGIPGASSGNGFITSGLGYQFTDHVTVGVQGGFTHYRAKSPGAPEAYSSGFGAGLFGRYTSYLGPRVFVYGQVDAGYLRDHIGSFGNNTLGVDVYPGMGVFIARNWALNATVNVFSFRTGDNGASAYFNVGQSVKFGISKNFGGKPKTTTKE